MSNHLFRISKEAWDACTPDEVKATCEVLKEAGLYALPYDSVDIEIPVDCAVNWTASNPNEDSNLYGFKTIETPEGTFRHSNLGPSVVLRLSSVSTEAGRPIEEIIIDYSTRKTIVVPEAGMKDVDRTLEHREADRAWFSDILIALLATRNVEKQTKQNKLAKLGIGKKNPAGKYEYVTTISTPPAKEMDDDAEHPPTGLTRCPHLRRAHLRNQHFGPGNQFVKRRLIRATFVNVDKEWTKTRIAYNVSL